MSQQAQHIHQLFEAFLEVCNRAIETHKDEFPYKHIWEAAETLQSDDGMHVSIYDDEPKGDYQLKIHDKQIELLQENAPPRPAGWRINTSHMRQVISDPDAYINEPTKLDWLWLKHRT
jgi:hypothetical protein